MAEVEILRDGTIDFNEDLTRLLALRPACARSSLLAHRTGELLAAELQENQPR